MRLFPSYAPHLTIIYVADKKGYFKARGLDVTVTLFAAGVEAVDAFRGGNAEFAVTGPGPSLRLWQDNQFVGVVPVNWSKFDNAMVARADIKTPADLKGKKIATMKGSGGEQLLYAVLDKAGLTDKDVTIVNVDPPSSVAALERGDVDAASYWDPFSAQALDTLGSRVRLLTSSEPYFTGTQIISGHRNWLKAHPEETKRMILALNDAADYVQKNFDDSIKIVNATLKGNEEVTTKLMKVQNFGVAWRAEHTLALREAVRYLTKIGGLKESPNLAEVMDLSHLRSANPSFVQDDLKSAR